MHCQPSRLSRPLLTSLSVGLIALFGCQGGSQAPVTGPPLSAASNHQAVLLQNGLSYFGKVEKADAKWLVLKEIYYIQSGVTKQANKPVQQNVLIKRGKEWHGPDRMTINLDQVVFIEPVSPTSEVARLISEASKTP